MIHFISRSHAVTGLLASASDSQPNIVSITSLLTLFFFFFSIKRLFRGLCPTPDTEKAALQYKGSIYRVE